MNKTVDYEELDCVIDAHGQNPSAIISILQSIQERHRYLPREVFPYLSKQLGISEAKIYSVATFYENFSLEPKAYLRRLILYAGDGCMPWCLRPCAGAHRQR